MLFLRKLTVGISAFLLGIFLLAGVGALAFNSVFGNPQTVKQTIAQSGFYDNFLDVGIELTQKPQEAKQGEAEERSFDLKALKQVLNESLPPSYIGQKFEQVIDGIYRWLNGQVKVPDYSVDLSDSKTRFTQNVSTFLINRWNSLPACSPAETKAIVAQEIDPFSVPCRVPGVAIEGEVAKVSDEISKMELFSKPITAASSEQKPSVFESDLKEAPKAFQTLQKIPLTAGIMAALAALVVVLASIDRRRGWSKLSHLLLSIGVFLGLSGLVISFGLGKLGESLAKNEPEQADAIQKLILPLMGQVGQEMGSVYLWSGIALTLSGLGIYIWLRQTRPPQTEVSLAQTPPGQPHITENPPAQIDK